MSVTFASVDELSEFLASGNPFDLNTMRAAIIALVQRAVATDAKLAALLLHADTVRPGAMPA